VSERTKKIEAIFHAASELSTPEAREGYLNEACLGDEDLRKEVAALLKAALVGEDLFQGCEESSRRAGNTAVESLAEQPGAMIGRYKLLEKIGEGGMGVVYMAEQEQPVRRKVALKIIKLGMDTRQVVARFEAERQALAMMDHPHIAQVLDTGATETGRPYFVMELVQGVPIAHYCETNRLSIEDRLKLFISVCHAIQSAHQKGIIHRDIKPSNVLVTLHNGQPHPMVIDFGVAKAIDQKLTEKTLFTNFGTMIGTPAYMSPEQAEMSKLDVDTRSDIYSLGVLLYELLTGTPPFPEERLRSVAYAEMQRIIVEEEPERPSTRLRKSALRGSPAQRATRHSSLATDLDWIVMKCLEKDRERRYETANGLAADIQQHLNNELVVARPPSAVYRARKTIRRHRLAFVAGGAVALALIGGIAASSWQAVKATKAEQKATEQAENAKAIKEFLLANLLGVDCCGDSAALEPDAASFEATQALLYKVARRIEGRFTNQAQVEAQIREALVKGFYSARDHRSIAAQAERLVQIHTRLSGPYHTNTLKAIADLATAKYHLGQRAEGMQLLTNTINAVRALDPPETNGWVAWLEGNYGVLLGLEGRTSEALPYLREVVAGPRRIDPNSTVSRAWAPRLADALDAAGQLAESETVWRETLESLVRDPKFGPTNLMTLDNQFGLGRVLVKQRRTDEALSVLSSVIASFQMRYGSNNFSTLGAQGWLALALDQKGDTAAVTRLYTDLHPRLMEYVTYVGARYRFEEMASFFVRQHNYAQAKSAYDALRQIYEALPPRNGFELNWFVRATAATQGWPAAVKIYREYGDRFTESVSQARARATVLLYAGDSDAYRHVVAKVLTSASSTNALNEQEDILNIALLGAPAFSPEQVNHCEALVGTFERGLESSTEQQQDSGHRALGGILFRLGRLTSSLEHLEIAEKKYPSGSLRARVLFLKALCLHRLGRADEARATFDKADAMTKQRLLKRVDEFEGFLTVDERTCLIHRREAQALFGLE
jgi:tetratricopeptide (TPR) repeat protein